MTRQPPYFERIRRTASDVWQELERRPDIAGPWHQLFKQVQSHRHVVSELLQNADDARATEASVRIENGVFLFSHNGEDFQEEHFQSICRFGFSNKRALHTIGFRGIGFKSTFSLGDNVELFSPTLSVVFKKAHFTEPHWIESEAPTNGETLIRVAIGDQNKLNGIEKNLQEWLKSPLSLLFFRNLRRLRIGTQTVDWQSLGPGPVSNTEWMALDGNADDAYLIARSEMEPFPPDALSEIKQERLLGTDQDAEFPPCRVELVLGAKGRLYVVLPTGVETTLPFACNAPFIQDSARVKIKEPEGSPTNQWLLRRIGELAASVMLRWLNQSTSSIEERSRAYEVLPNVNRDGDELECACGILVEDAFDNAVQGKPFLLTQAGEVKPDGESVVIPEELFDVWPAEIIAPLLDEKKRPIFSRHVSAADKQKLVHRTELGDKTKFEVQQLLQSQSLPTPGTWRELLNLWVYIAPELTSFSLYSNVKQQFRIFPVQGKDELYSAVQIVRLGEKKLLQTDADWEFLSAHLLVLNPNWTRYLADQRRTAAETKSIELGRQTDAAHSILNNLSLVDASDVNGVIEKVATAFFAQAMPIERCVQLTQIAAKLNASGSGAMRYVTQDNLLRHAKHALVCDADGSLQDILPEAWSREHLLHAAYTRSFNSCTAEEWNRWIDSPRSGLSSFVPLKAPRHDFWSEENLRRELVTRGWQWNPGLPYKTTHFALKDFDFDSSIWAHWTLLAKSDPGLWQRLIERILAQPKGSLFERQRNAEMVQVATTGSEKSLVPADALTASWILKFRELPCLPDTRGFCRKPGELMLRTPETESLLEVEPFIHKRLDTEAAQPLLLLLGVSNTPSSPDRLLDRLRALSKSSSPPAQEVDKWYRRLDQLSASCDTTDLAAIRNTLRDEKLILTENLAWTTAAGVFLTLNEDDVPCAEVIRASVRDLTLWRRIGVAEHPTADLAIKWLQALPSGKALDTSDAGRVKALLGRHAFRVWSECEHWTNLLGEWVPTEALQYSLSMQGLIHWGHLFTSVRRQTADFRSLPVELNQIAPFCALPSLASSIEDRFERSLLLDNNPERRPWLNQVGVELRRINLENKDEMQRVRDLGAELESSVWQVLPNLEIIPYIDGQPAGTPRRAEVVWLNKTVYVDRLPLAKQASVVPIKLGNLFGRGEITAALHYCFGRSPQEVSEYFEENFELVPRSEIESGADDSVPATEIHPAEGNGVAPEQSSDSSESEFEEKEVVAEAVPEAPHLNGNGAAAPELPDLESGAYKMRPLPKPQKPSLIECFARSRGFRKDSAECFVHSDGSHIARVHGSPFPWERRSPQGEVVRYYWPKDHCIELEPLQLESDVWGLIDKFPDRYSLVLANPENDPVEVMGTKLREMLDGGNLNLFPATYRLVHRTVG